MHDPKFVEEMKQLLLSKKNELEHELSLTPKHTELGDDMDSKVQEYEDDEVSQRVRSALVTDLQKIEKALAKIHEGSYGIDSNGNEISEARLRVLPWADNSI